MTQASEKEDEHWLKALAGNPDPGADPKLNLQAESLRRALQARKRLLDTEVPIADAGPYQQILFRLRRENFPDSEENESQGGVYASVARAARQHRLEDDGDSQVKSPADHESWLAYRLTWRSPLLWGLAATIGLGAGIVIKMSQLGNDDADISLGRGTTTVLMVAEPEVRLAELLAGLRATGEVPSVKTEPDGRIVLTIKGSAKVLVFLGKEHIQPTTQQGNVTIELRPMNPQR